MIASIEPPAEMVHWWFATGFLVLGLLLLSEAVVGPEVWGKRPWRRALWPGVLFAMGVLMFPVMALYTSSTIHMLAHGSWAQVMMLAGAAELGVARGKLRSRYWRLCSALGFAVSGVAVLVHEQNHWLFSRTAFLHHVLGWAALVAAIFPILQTFRPRVARGRVRVRDDVRPDRGAPLLRPRHGRDLRPPRLLRRGAAPVNRLAVVAAALAALAAPASALAHATLVQTAPALGQELARAPAQVVLTYDQPVDAVREAVVVLNAKGVNVAGTPRAEKTARELIASLPKKLPNGAYTVRWRALSSDGHVVSGVYTFGVGVPAPPVTEAVGAQGPTSVEHVVRWLYFLSLALLVGGIGFRLLVVPGPLPARAERRFYLLVGAGAVAVLEVGIVSVHAPRRGRAPAAARRLPLRRPLLARKRNALRDRVRRHDARLRARGRARRTSPG